MLLAPTFYYCAQATFVEEALPSKTFGQLFGHTYTSRLSNIQDNTGNTMKDYTFESNFACYPPMPAITVTHPAGECRHYLPNVANYLKQLLATIILLRIGQGHI